jgi:hypothetical protein
MSRQHFALIVYVDGRARALQLLASVQAIWERDHPGLPFPGLTD